MTPPDAPVPREVRDPEGLETGRFTVREVQDAINAVRSDEQRQDRASMVREAEQKGRDLIHAYGDARINAYVTRGGVIHAAKAADAFAKLMLLLSELARVAYE